MEAVPRLPMICCDLKVSPSGTEFGPVLKKYIRDHYHEDPESYSKEIKELESLRQNAIKAPMDFTGCSLLKKYYSQLQKLQSRFPMTDDGAACVPFMWTDIYSGVAYNITDIEYEEACILYNIGALHSKLGTMDSRINAEGIKIACTHFQCAAFAFQHLRDTYPQPKGSDMSHDLLTFFINVMLAQAQECILEKSMLDNRKSSITAKIAAQVVDYYKCALGIMVSGSPSTDTGSILDIVGSKMYKGWKKFIQFKMSYYTSISHLYMGNQAEENEKWGERVAWFQSAFDHLTEAFKIGKKIDRDDLNEALTFTNDVIGGKHSSSKKENDFVYHDKVPVLSSLPELKGASLVKGIPFSSSDPDVSGPDIFARLVPMEAHETSSLYSEEKAKILRTVVSKIEGKNEELMAYLSSLQLESATSFDDEDKIPQELIEKCAALSVRPTAIADLNSIMNELLEVSKDVETSLKTSVTILAEEDQKELKHQETFGKRGPSMIIVELKKECSKYEEAHKKAIESNKTLQTAVNIHVGNLTKLTAPLDQITESLPSACSIKTPENVKVMDEFNHLVNKVEEMRKQRQFLENQLRDALMKDDITKRLVTLNKKDDVQQTFEEELKKHNETLTYLDQNLTAQDNILCALTEANARYADTRKALTEIRLRREEMINTLINSFDAYEDLMEKTKKGLEFYRKLQCNTSRLLSRIKSVTKVQDEERAQRAEAELRKGGRVPGLPNVTQDRGPKLKDYLPYLNKRNGAGIAPSAAVPYSMYPSLQPNVTPGPYLPEQMRQATLGGPAPAEFNRSLKPSPTDNARPEENFDVSSMGIRPTPVGSEQTSVPAMCTTALSNVGVGQNNPYANQQQPWGSVTSPPNNNLHNSQPAHPYSAQNLMHQPMNNTSQSPFVSNASASAAGDAVTNASHSYKPSVSIPSTISNSFGSQNYPAPHLPASIPAAVSSTPYSSLGNLPQSNYPSSYSNIPGAHPSFPPTSTAIPGSVVSPGSATTQNSAELRSGHPASSMNMPNSSLPTSSPSVPPNSGYPVNSAHPASSIPPANSTIPPGTVHPSGSKIQPFSSDPPGSVPRPNSAVSSSVYQPNAAALPGSAQYPMSSAYQNSLNYSLSSTPPNANTTLSSAVPQNFAHHPTVASSSGVVSAGTYPNVASYTGMSGGASGVESVSPMTSGVSNSFAAMPRDSYTMPYSNVQQTANASSSGVMQQNQSYPAWGANSYSINHILPNAYNAGVGSGMPYSSVEYYQGPGAPVQAKQACVTASMDTKTNTLNSLNPYAVANSNVSHYLEQNAHGYIASNSVNSSNMSTTGMTQVHAVGDNSRMSPAPANITGPGAQTGNVVSQTGMYASSGNASVYSSVPSSHFYASNAAYNYNNYTYTSPNGQMMSNLAYVGNMPATSTVQNLPAGQNMSFPSAGNVQSNSYAIPTQQNYQTAVRTDNSSCINAAYGSSPNIHNQQLQAPIEPKPIVPNQPVQSPVISSHQMNSECQSSTTESLPKSSSTDLQTSVQRDFITPPPDPVVTEVDKETIPVLQPKVIDLKAIAEMKEKDSSHLAKDPLDDPSVCAKFVSEVEKYEKFVDGLVRKSLNGTTPLDQKWKEFTDVQDKESRKMSISVARCCPLKNRFPDVMPYDNNRVKLISSKDDYINASYLKDICPNCPVFVITQAPLPATFSDFWLMVWEQQVETLICLLSDAELKNHVYFPKERGQVLTFGTYEISLHSHKEKNGFVERMINLTHSKNRTSRVVVHLQFTEWPISGVPSSPATLQFISDTLSYYKQQRNLLRPIVVHCSAGIGRSGCFCIITAMVSDMNNGHGPRDVTQVTASVSHQRKFLIQDKDQLKFCYDTVLYYAQDVLMRRGGLVKLQSGIAKLGFSSSVSESKAAEAETKSATQDVPANEVSVPVGNGGILTTRASFEDKLPGSTNTSSHVRHPSEDFILGGGLAKLQSGIAKMGFSSDGPESKAAESETNSATQDFLADDVSSVPVGNGDVKQNIIAPENKPKEAPKPDAESNENFENSKTRKGSADKHVPSITSLLDPSNFTLDSASSPAKRKITKENFASSKGSLSTSSSDNADPLSQLDPLWSLKK